MQSGVCRLKETLEKAQLTGTVDMSKVKIVEGDITTEKFGLKDDVYNEMCEYVDAIVHSAVRSDHTSKYWKAPDSKKSHMRTVNVLGTVRLLEFAAKKRLKHFFHSSTMLAFTGTGENGNFSEGWQDVSAFDTAELNGFGYVVSKHISEQLVHRALLKGIPCKAFRLPIISGDSRTGRVNYKQNHAIIRWLTCMKIGAIHDLPIPLSAIPVDHCAKLCLDIFFNPLAPMDIYNVVHKSLEAEQVLVEVAQGFGISLEIESFEQFLDKLKSEDENSPIAAFIKMYETEASEFISMFENPSFIAMKKYFEEGATFLDTSKLEKYAPQYEQLLENTRDVLKRDFAYLKSEGVFAKYGIQTSS